MTAHTMGLWIHQNEAAYLDALQDAQEGNRRQTRNGVTKAIFARQVRFDLKRGFPVTTTKQLMFKSMAAELVWFFEAGQYSPIPYRLSVERLNQLMGLPTGAFNPLWSNDQQRFEAAGKAQFPGDCGVIYGSQWRNFNGEGKDQFAEVIAALKKDPFSRYHVITAWNPLKTHDMCLPACHMKMQFFVRQDEEGRLFLSLAMDQRSCDMFLGVPFNIASEALKLALVAQCVGMTADELIITLDDCHVYEKHEEAVRTQLARDTLPPPKLWLNPEIQDIDSFTVNDVKLIDYKHQGRIEAPLL